MAALRSARTPDSRAAITRARSDSASPYRPRVSLLISPGAQSADDLVPRNQVEKLIDARYTAKSLEG